MTISQQTSSLFDTTREAGLDARVEVVVNVGNPVPSLQDVHTTGRNGTKDGTVETVMLPRRDHQPFTYPAWPTSTPGPQATLPPPGQKSHPRRTDQMVYVCYDQERGMPCAPPPTGGVRQNRTRTSLPDAHVQEAASLVEAIERWLDDGGALDHASKQDGGSVVGDDGIGSVHKVSYQERANTDSVPA